MIANDDLHKELAVFDEAIAKEKEPIVKHLLKMGSIIIKLLHNIRSNQVTDLKSRNVELVKPKGKPTETVAK